MSVTGKYISSAQSAWINPPDWVLALARACDASTQSAVAKSLNINAAYVSFAINNKSSEYHERVEEAVRAKYMAEVVVCPVLGEVALDICGGHQRNTRRPTGPVQRQLRETCPGCPFNRTSKDKGDHEGEGV